MLSRKTLSSVYAALKISLAIMQLGKLIFEIKAAYNGWDIFTIIKIKIISLIKIR